MGEGSDLEQVHLVVEGIQVVLRVDFSLIGCHSWHSESSRQWLMLDLRTKGRSWCWWCGLDVFDRQLLKPSSQFVNFIINRRDDWEVFYHSGGRWIVPCSKWVRTSSSLFRPSQSKTLWDGLRESSIGFLSRDFMSASGLMVRPEAILFWGRDVPASACPLLIVVVEQLDSAYDWVTWY